MLHILNGDSTFAKLRPLALPGRALVWRDALLDGPVPHGLRTEADWALRARALSAEQGVLAREFLAGVREFLRDLDSQATRDEVVLWFEEDLFCQLPLAYLLSRKPDGAKWSVVCHEERLGTAPTDKLAIFYDERRVADEALVWLATRAWDAYSSEDPTRIEALLREDFAAWPLLKRGLLLHLLRFPSTRDGLSVIERAALTELSSGAVDFPALFLRWNGRPEVRDYGLGDLQLAHVLWRLASSLDPLVRLDGAPPEMRAGTLESCGRWNASLTRVGQAVLAGSRDAASLGAHEGWLGGVRLGAGRPAWRWDDARGALTRG